MPNPFIVALDYRPTPAPTTDEGWIQDALDAGAAMGAPATVVLDTGTYSLAGGLSVPSGVRFTGMGSERTELQVPSGASFSAVTLSAVSHAAVIGMRVVELSYANLGASPGVLVTGASSSVLVEDVATEGFLRGIDISNTTDVEHPAAADYVSDIVVRDCSTNYARQFGLRLARVRRARIERHQATGNWFDGIKLNEWTLDTHIVGGYLYSNGLSGNGQGIDALAGGESFIVEGTVLDGNAGGNLYIKTAWADSSFAPGTDHYEGQSGYVRRVRLYGVKSRNSTTTGIEITRNDADVRPTEALVTDCVIDSCEILNAATFGIYHRGMNTRIVNTTIRYCGQTGINDAYSYNTVYRDNVIVACGQSSPGSYPGITVSAGNRVQVVGNYINGCDDAEVGDDSYSGLTVYHSRPIRILGSSQDVLVENNVCLNWAGAGSLPVELAGGYSATSRFVIHYGEVSSSIVPQVNGLYGHYGSTCRIGGKLFEKWTDCSELYGWVDRTTHAGTTANRPTRPKSTVTNVMISYFDTTLGKPIFGTSVNWYDATGAVV